MSAVRLIAVVGSGTCGAETAEVAERVGRLLAHAGFGVVCGGLGGVMESACRGAAQAGGLTVGILPGSSASEANPFVRVAIPTGMGEARNVLVVRAAEAVIAVEGEYGTLSEIALALKLGKPVVGIASWKLESPRELLGGVAEASTPEEAVRAAIELIGNP